MFDPKDNYDPKSSVRIRRQRAALLSPTLLEALSVLAANEDLPVPTLIAVLINEALSHRMRRPHRSRSC